MNRTKILLTGGSGFIGKNILESYLSDKYDIDAPSSKDLNLADEISVNNYFKTNNPNIVIHAAVKPGHRNAKDTKDLLITNARMFYNLERMSHNYDKMLLIGSGAIYDNRYYLPKIKESQWQDHLPADEHGFCKYLCNRTIESSNNIYDLRVFGIFGKYEDYSIRFISNAICKTLFDLPISIKQNRKFDYLYINDLMQILDWFILNEPKHKCYNITPDKSISLYDIATIVREIAGNNNIPIQIANDDMGLEYSGDNSLLKQEFSAKFTDIRTAIQELYSWYASNKENINQQALLIDK